MTNLTTLDFLYFSLGFCVIVLTVFIFIIGLQILKTLNSTQQTLEETKLILDDIKSVTSDVNEARESVKSGVMVGFQTLLSLFKGKHGK